MLNSSDNELLTRTGPGTPMGELFRRFWHPVLLAAELPEPDGPPVRLRVLSEDLVAFRDTEGQVGVIDALCPHGLLGCDEAPVTRWSRLRPGVPVTSMPAPHRAVGRARSRRDSAS